MASTLEEKQTTPSEGGEPSSSSAEQDAETDLATVMAHTSVDELLPDTLLQEVQLEAELAVQQMVDDSCELDESGQPVDEICADEVAKAGFRNRMRSVISSTLNLVRGTTSEDDDQAESI